MSQTVFAMRHRKLRGRLLRFALFAVMVTSPALGWADGNTVNAIFAGKMPNVRASP